MEWKDLTDIAGKAAPLIGAAFGGPAGAVVGALVGHALGVNNNPDDIAAHLADNPDALLKLKELEAAHEVELKKLLIQGEANRLAAETAQMQEETKQQEAVNQTMQAETKSEWWFSAAWRPFWGVTSAIAFLLVVMYIGYLTYLAVSGRQPEAISMIPQLITSFAMLFGIPGAILGVTAWHRGKMQRAQAGEERGALDAIKGSMESLHNKLDKAAEAPIRQATKWTQ